jgi:hypothetical protein
MDEGYEETIVQGERVLVMPGDKHAILDGRLYVRVGEEWMLSAGEAPSRHDHFFAKRNELGRDVR